MAFTASHYLEVAAIIRAHRARLTAGRGYIDITAAVTTLDLIRGDLSAMFTRQNPKFDAARFARDCTPKEG